jgi:hypothetical protein
LRVQNIEQPLPTREFDIPNFVSLYKKESTNFELDTADSKLGNVVGRRAVHKSSGVPVWVEVYDNTRDSRPLLARMAMLAVMSRIRGIVTPRKRYHGFYATGGRVALVLPFYPNGSLGDVLQRYRAGDPPATFGATEFSKCLFGIALRMARLHARGAVLGGLFPARVFLDERFEPVIRMGSPRQLVHVDSVAGEIFEFGLLDCEEVMYMPPEALYNDEWNASSDYYTFGVLIFHFFAAFFLPTRNPLASERRGAQLAKKIRDGWRFDIPSELPEFLRQMITAASKQYHERPTFSRVVKQLLGNDDWLFPGTDVASYREYCVRLLVDPPKPPRPEAVFDEVCRTIENAR